MAKRRFRGVINTDVRDSVPDWAPYKAPVAKEGSPNILYVVVDDTGIAAWDCFGGLIEVPNIGRLAKSGLRFTNWHTTALCSPTRSCLLTGRDATRNGMANITEGSQGFPGLSGYIPPENGMISEILRDAGYATIGIGKWHLTPTDEQAASSTKRTWPLGRGFERFYGFLGAETNQWYPDLVLDNGAIGQPKVPEEGYHLSADLCDRAIQFISDVQITDPDKPWLCYLAFGANHAPHQVPQEWIDKYRGKFDMGYEKYRSSSSAPSSRWCSSSPTPRGRSISRSCTPRRRSAACSIISRRAISSTTRSWSSAPTTARAARAAPTGR